MKENKCQICGKYFNNSETYEYRGFFACEKHFDELCEIVNHERKEGNRKYSDYVQGKKK